MSPSSDTHISGLGVSTNECWGMGDHWCWQTISSTEFEFAERTEVCSLIQVNHMIPRKPQCKLILHAVYIHNISLVEAESLLFTSMLCNSVCSLIWHLCYHQVWWQQCNKSKYIFQYVYTSHVALFCSEFHCKMRRDGRAMHSIEKTKFLYEAGLFDQEGGLYLIFPSNLSKSFIHDKAAVLSILLFSTCETKLKFRLEQCSPTLVLEPPELHILGVSIIRHTHFRSWRLF